MKNQRSAVSGQRSGFTLLELLVVVGIISILVALMAVTFSVIQARSRDARRREDLKAMQDALEQYYSNNGFVYPVGTAACTAGIELFMKSSSPVDPKTGADYDPLLCEVDNFCICAQMEASGVSAGNSTSNDCASWGNGDYYCVANLQ